MKSFSTRLLFACGALLASQLVVRAQVPDTFPDPDNKPPAPGPVKVYVMAGQSNMVGIGNVDGGGSRWGKEFLEPVLSVCFMMSGSCLQGSWYIQGDENPAAQKKCPAFFGRPDQNLSLNRFPWPLWLSAARGNRRG